MNEEYLTIQQVEAKYPQQWVVLNHLKIDRHGHAAGGVVVAHGTDKEGVYGVMNTIPPPRELAAFYTGPLPDDVEFLL